MDGLETTKMLGTMNSVNLVFYVGLQWGRPECILVAEYRSSIRRGFQEKVLHTSNSRTQDTASQLYG